ncbi:sensor histidine kinase [Streptosporangium carneum]|uniref:histidine kinase n=1 Tax=Streptosporangium carneum TaxID=47481 RepID=A0A9W6HYQ1_9ACTN|nr:histidine kinase [Streptosporangium carneum]GLK08807.1 two-component sensor histidine kinase [Streptosporangium carneum]
MNLPAGLERLLRPLTLALIGGRADPPFPRSPRLRIRLPAFLGLLPFRAVDLVVVANALIFWFVYSEGLTELMVDNARLPAPVPEWWVYLAAVTTFVPVLLREQWPLAAWRIALASVFLAAPIRDVMGSLPVSTTEAVPHLLVVYSVAVRCERRTTAGVWTVSLLVLALSSAEVNQILLAATLLGVTALLGYNVRIRRLAASRLAEEESRSERALAAQAALEERARIARELHDVVAHHMSVIAIQAEAVPLQAAGNAERLEEGLREIRALSLAAMTEMRRVLGVLRDGDGRTDTAPQPGLERLEELVGTARSAGLTVTLSLGGVLTGLPTAVSLSAYRIAQESLSNAMRHAPGSTVSVRISRSGDELHVHVANDAGLRSPAKPGHVEGPGHAGHGLIGMRERVSMLGGRLWAGPVGTGFAITAILPIMENT